jgi:hypothetical protein
MFQYIENFVTGSLKEDLEKTILKSPTWLWQYRSETSGGVPAPDYAWIEDSNTEDSPQLIHVVNESAKDMILMSPLIYKISDIVGYTIQLQRIKTNLLWPDANRKNPQSYHRPHVDHGRPDAKTLIYYVNDSDGDTIIFKNAFTGEDPGPLEELHRITPKAGSAILLDSTMYHASSSPTTGVRSVINFIFWPKTEEENLPGSPPVPVNIPVGKGFNRI